MNEYAVVPEVTMETMKNYVENHVPTGDFLRAVFSNDLVEAVGRADSQNILVLKEIVQWVMCMAPLECHGSPEKYAAWI